MGNDRTAMPCPVAWCDGEHKPSESYIHHRAAIGTAALQGDPLTVFIRATESRTGGEGISPSVSLRWRHIEGDGTEVPEMDGVDLDPDEAEALAVLLVQAAVMFRTGRRP